MENIIERLFYYLFENGKVIFWFFTLPISAYILQNQIIDGSISRRTNKNIILISGVLALPLLTGYFYVLPFSYEFLIYLFIASYYAHGDKKILLKSAIKACGFLFLIFGFCTLISMTGYIRTENEWLSGRYKIEYRIDQGFAGGPLMTYKLSKYAMVPIFIKHLETKIDNDTLQKCLIHFSLSGVSFDKCKGTIIDEKPKVE